jgi:integrase
LLTQNSRRLKKVLSLIRDFVELEGFVRIDVGLMRMISEMLGHSTIQLAADTYTHLMAESKREMAEKIDVIT